MDSRFGDDDLDWLHEPQPDVELTTLYVMRPLLNAIDLITWAKSVGFKTTLPDDDMHVTIAYSRKPVDWTLVVPDQQMLLNNVGGRSLALFGPDQDVAVLKFSSSALAERHEEFKAIGATWDWPSYEPHVTISLNTDGLDIRSIEPYAGDLYFGPEQFAEVKEGWAEDVVEKVDHAENHGTMITQAEASYVDQSPFDDKCCRLCTMFRPNAPTSPKMLASCSYVRGSISPRGWCRYFKASK